jgi:cytochrome d ubiquinol oxidase subunit II
VWLLTAGGALFAAFPKVYATVFSSFYLALMLLLVFLILRAVSMEFRGKVESLAWRRLWDWAFGLGSLGPALLFGVAVGNILRGIPITDERVFTGTFFSLLNPYALLVGSLSLVMFTMHGALYMTLKTDGELQERMKGWAAKSWVAFILLYVAATIATFFVSPFLFESVLGNPVFWVFFVLLLVSILYIPVATNARRYWAAMLASSLTILSMIGLAAVSMFPVLVPSTLDAAYSLTAYNAASTPKTHTVMLIIALIGMPIVIAYTIYIYRVFKGKVVITEDSY